MRRNNNGQFRLTAQQRHNLHLCSEEIFIYLCRADSEADTQRHISFRATAREDGILTEITDRSEAKDIDFPQVPTDLETASVEELNELGLFLVSKIATTVIHQKISGYNYITFEIPH